MEKNREIWVDDVKVIACTLVVLGHFFQSMIKASILPANAVYQWFDQTIYFFHVPLFFICSGYLFQKFNAVNSFNSWKKNIIKKALVLGVPYFVFSIATWLLKLLFSGAVNDGVEENLFSVLFLHPVSPYWYLYALFFVFLITPTFKNVQMAVIGLVIALIGKIMTFIQIGEIFVVSTVLSNEIWFVAGMCLAIYALKPNRKWIAVGTIAGGVFIISSVAVYDSGIKMSGLSFLMGIIACLAVIAIVVAFDNGRKRGKVFAFLAEYTMPIFLMHTLFAAGLRSILLKYTIDGAVIHVVSGILISFIGPIIATKIMKKVAFLECILYPGKFIKKR